MRYRGWRHASAHTNQQPRRLIPTYWEKIPDAQIAEKQLFLRKVGQWIVWSSRSQHRIRVFQVPVLTCFFASNRRSQRQLMLISVSIESHWRWYIDARILYSEGCAAIKLSFRLCCFGYAAPRAACLYIDAANIDDCVRATFHCAAYRSQTRLSIFYRTLTEQQQQRTNSSHAGTHANEQTQCALNAPC